MADADDLNARFARALREGNALVAAAAVSASADRTARLNARLHDGQYAATDGRPPYEGRAVPTGAQDQTKDDFTRMWEKGLRPEYKNYTRPWLKYPDSRDNFSGWTPEKLFRYKTDEYIIKKLKKADTDTLTKNQILYHRGSLEALEDNRPGFTLYLKEEVDSDILPVTRYIPTRDIEVYKLSTTAMRRLWGFGNWLEAKSWSEASDVFRKTKKTELYKHEVSNFIAQADRWFFDGGAEGYTDHHFRLVRDSGSMVVHDVLYSLNPFSYGALDVISEEDAREMERKEDEKPFEEKWLDGLDPDYKDENYWVRYSDDRSNYVEDDLDAPEDELRYKTSAKRLEVFTEPRRKAVYKKGIVLYHGGETGSLDEKECCFFLSTGREEASVYGHVTAYVTTRDLILYNWGWPDIAGVWGYIPWEEYDSWEEAGENYDSNYDGYARDAEYEANQSLADLGLDGRWDDMDEEVGLTPQAYDALRKITSKEAKQIESATRKESLRKLKNQESREAEERARRERDNLRKWSEFERKKRIRLRGSISSHIGKKV